MSWTKSILRDCARSGRPRRDSSTSPIAQLSHREDHSIVDAKMAKAAIEGYYRQTARLRHRRQVGISPRPCAGLTALRQVAESGFHFGRLGNETHAQILAKPVVRSPGFALAE